MMRTRLKAMAAALAALTVLGANDASAQRTFEAQGQRPVQLQITPFAGGGLFLSDLPDRFALAGEDGVMRQFTDAALEAGAALGTHIGVRVHPRLAVEGTFAFQPTSLTGAGQADTDATIFNYGGGLVFYPKVPARFLEPFLALGAGAKSYDFEGAGLHTETDFMWNVGGGLDLRLGRHLAVRLEARDYMSRFESGIAEVDSATQHDLVLAAGFSLRLDRPRAHASRH